MTLNEVYENKATNEFYTLVMPSGEDGNELLVMTDIKFRGDDCFICWRDICYSQPMYMQFYDLKNAVGETALGYSNLWTIDDIEATVDHQD